MAVCTHCATPLPGGSRFCSHCGTRAPGTDADSPTSSPQSRELFERLEKATEGKYEVVSEIGRGGMAVVFLGYQMSLDRYIAIKVLLPFLGFDTELVERFLREARTQGRLDHPSIVKVYEIYNQGGLSFFTMPFVSGQSLRKLLEDEPQPPLAKVHRYMCQAADALAYAHRRGVVHRDVKPDNMVLDEERDCVILTDFGIAKALSAESTLTTPGDLLGTPHYMSPEQGEGKIDLDGRTDQYSLGLVGYEMLAGRRPFEATNLAELMYKHRFEDPERLEVVRPDAPDEMRLAISQSISKNRDDRFPTMEAFLAALESCTPMIGAVDELPTEPMPRVATGDTTQPERTATSGSAATAGADGALRPVAAGAGDAPRRGGSRVVWIGGAVAVVLVAALGLTLGPVRSLLTGGDAAGGALATAPAGTEAEGSGAEMGAGAEQTAEPDGGAQQETTETKVDDAGDAGATAEAGSREDDRAIGGDPGEPRDEEGRALALAQQARVARAQQAAVAAGAADIFGAELARLNSQLQDANREMEAGAYELARGRYTDLAQEFAALTQKSENARENGGLDAVAARREMERLRRTAVDAGLRQRAPLAFTSALFYANQARGQFDAGDYSSAAKLYEQAGRAYQDLLDRFAEGPVSDSGEERGTELSAEETISALVDRFGELFASEDLSGMSAELYKSQIPDEDRQFLRTIFERADDINVTQLDRNLDVGETSATADVRLRMRFRQSRTRAAGDRDLRLELRFVSGAAGWRLASLRPRG